MDISEISDPATPLSSSSEVLDNQKSDANALDLDNASAVAASVVTNNMSARFTTDELFKDRMTTNMTSSLSTSKSNVKSVTSTMTTSATNSTSDEGAQYGKEHELGNWSSAGEDSTLSREHSESKLSLEGLDLELPTLEMYQEEYVDFPSSPTHENFQPHLLGGERDSGNAGGSEEEEEDTSIYRAVLSPNCQDVRLRKELTVGVASKVDSTIAATTINSVEPTAAHVKSDIDKPTQRKILSPDPEDAELPDIGDIPTIVEDTTSVELLPKPHQLHKSRESLCGIKPLLSLPIVDDGSDEDNSDFVFERRDSKRLAQSELGERVIEGLFVESRKRDCGGASGLRKISVPDEVMNTPESDLKDSCSSIEKKYAKEKVQLKPQPMSRKLESLDSESGYERPIPASRLKLNAWDSSNVRKMTSPPCPKPRRKNRSAISLDPSDYPSQGCQLLLNPLKLDSQSYVRRVPNVNPDGTVEVQERPGSLISSQCGGRRRIRVTADILGGHSRDDEEEDDAEDCNASSGGRSSRLSDADLLSPGEEDADLDAFLSPGIDTPDELEDSIMERLGEPPPMTIAPASLPIPELSAAEERVESRNWRSCIVQGIERRIDMKVIEPYKRVLSHGGYLTAGSHNAIIVFSACFLPDRSRVDYDYVMDNLFLYVLTTLDQLITEDYVLIYLHGATQRSCMPTFTWLKRCYQLIDRRLRKNLKGLYLVHPTFWLKTIVLMTKPFISSKFSRKLRFVDTLSELAAVVPLEQASIPDRVKQLDGELEERAAKRRSLLNWWWTQTPDTTTVSS